MRRDLKLRNDPISKLQNSSRGYILITLMLFFTVLAIAALAILPEIAQQIKRDREEEMIHRGVQYTRAIQRYYKKFGRYPSRIEELESSNNLRFLRKRYKDPIANDKDFRLLRLGDPALTAMGFGQGFGQGIQQAAAAQALAQGTGPGALTGPGGVVRPTGPGVANLPGVTGLPGGTAVQTVTQADSPENADAPADDSKANDSTSPTSASSPGLGGQLFGGGPIVGVASTSKAKTIREFNNKSHYKDWPFIYDPTNDRGGLLNTPTQPNLGRGFSNPGQMGTPAGQSQQNPQQPGSGQQSGPPQPQDPPLEQ